MICLTSTYFQYNGKHYKQLHGTAMGSPVSVVVAEIVMQSIEEQALATYKQTVPLWLPYVDDTFTAIHKDEIDTFHEHLNRQNADIQFTREVEENGKIPFLTLSSKPTRQQTTDYYLQETDSYPQITRPVIVQPYFSQSDDHTDFDKTSATSLRLNWQLKVHMNRKLFYVVITFSLWNTWFRSLRRLGQKLAKLQALKVPLFYPQKWSRNSRDWGQVVT